MTQEAAPEDLVDTLLAGANGRRRARTLSRNEVEKLVEEALGSPTGVAFRHGGVSDARARTTLCLVVVQDEHVTAGVAEVSAQDADPGRAWAELRPWNNSLPEANVSRARAWAARRKSDRVRWKLLVTPARDGEALLRRVLEQPDDDEPRLVYADWLTEQGDPRGELISVQCRRARLAPGEANERELRLRELQLLKTEALTQAFGRWLGFEWSPLVMDRGAVAEGHGLHGADRLKIDRGFVSEVAAQGKKLTELSALLEREPVRRLDVYTSGAEDGARIAAFRGLQRVRVLGLVSLAPLGPEGLSLLLESRELHRLEALVLRGQALHEDGLRFLIARGPDALPGLRSLQLHDDAIDAPSLRALRSTRWCRKLNELTLEHSLPAGGPGIEALSAGAPTDWRSLNLDHNGLGAADLRPLFYSDAFASLKRLSLCRNNLSAVAPLLSSPLLGSLEQLLLSGNPLSDSAKSALRARLGERVVLD